MPRGSNLDLVSRTTRSSALAMDKMGGEGAGDDGDRRPAARVAYIARPRSRRKASRSARVNVYNKSVSVNKLNKFTYNNPF